DGARNVDQPSLRAERHRGPRNSTERPRRHHDRINPVGAKYARALHALRHAAWLGACRDERIANREWLRRRGLHAWFLRNGPLFDPDERFSVRAIKDVHETSLTRVHQDLAHRAAKTHVSKDGGGGAVVIP